MRTSRTLVAAAVIGLAAATLAGCGGSTPTQGQAESAACDAIAQVKAATDDVASLNADSTVADAQAAKKALDDAVSQLETAATDLKAADSAALQAGGQALSSAIDSVQGSDTLGAAGAAIGQAGTALRTAVDQITNGLNCS